VLTDPEALATFQTWEHEEDNEVKPAAEEDLRVKSLVDKIAQLQYTHRIHLKPAFQDFDRSKNGCVTERQFRSLVGTYPLRIAEGDWTLLLNHYRRGGLGVSYAKFCEDVAAGERARSKEGGADLDAEAKEPTARTATATWNRPIDTTPGPSTADAVVDRIRIEFERTRCDITDVFYDFDTLRKGHVSQSQFRRCLSMKTVHVSEPELAALIAAYSPYPSRVDYVSFCNAIYAVPNRRFGHTSPPLQLEPQKAAVPRPDGYVPSGGEPTGAFADYAGGGVSPGAAAAAQS